MLLYKLYNSMQAGQSPLYVASAYGQMAAVRFLLEHGADVNLPTDVCAMTFVLLSFKVVMIIYCIMHAGCCGI